MAQQNDPVFLERESYRRRRLGDAARLVPLLGLILLLVPVLWADSNRTEITIIYIFSVWAFLIVLIGAISRHLSKGVLSEEENKAESRTGER